jgi:flagellar hook-associated protein 2
VATSTFSVSGLASGIDSQSIIDKLVQLESAPLANLQKRQSAFRAQVSSLADLASRLGALATAAQDLGSHGALAHVVSSSNVSFAATPASAAQAGTYDVQVRSLASAAKWRSGPLAPGATVALSGFTLTAGGKPYPVKVGGSGTLGDVLDGLRASGAPVSAAVLNDGTSDHLSITALATGAAASFTLDAAATSALDPTGNAVSAPGTDAVFSVDRLEFTRPSNTVADAVPGTTLTLKATGASETLSIAQDAAGTQARIQKLVDGYNGLMGAIQRQLSVSKDTDRSTTLAGDATVRGLGQALHGLVSASAATSPGGVRTLADLGLTTQRDGTLALDPTVLGAALARDPAAVDAVFADAASGVARRAKILSDAYTTPSTGLLALRQGGLQKQIVGMDDQVAAMQRRIDTFRQGLVTQFTAMETVVGQLKSIGNFLTMQDDRSTTK